MTTTQIKHVKELIKVCSKDKNREAMQSIFYNADTKEFVATNGLICLISKGILPDMDATGNYKLVNKELIKVELSQCNKFPDYTRFTLKDLTAYSTVYGRYMDKTNSDNLSLYFSNFLSVHLASRLLALIPAGYYDVHYISKTMTPVCFKSDNLLCILAPVDITII